MLGPLGAGRRTCFPREERRCCPQGEQRHCPQGKREGYRSLCTRPCHYRRHRHILHTLVGVDGETYGRLRVVLCVWWCCGGVVVFRGVLRFKKGFWVCGSGGVFESCQSRSICEVPRIHPYVHIYVHDTYDTARKCKDRFVFVFMCHRLLYFRLFWYE